MLVQKNNPIGLDLKVSLIQSRVYSILSNKINNYESHPRCYKDYKDGMVVPVNYVGDGEYSEVLYDDKFNLTSFFVEVDNASISNGLISQDVELIFQGNLKKIFPTLNTRADEEFKALVIDSLSPYDLVEVKKEIENVYSEFNFKGTLKDRIVIHNMSELFVMKFKINLSYQYNC